LCGAGRKRSTLTAAPTCQPARRLTQVSFARSSAGLSLVALRRALARTFGSSRPLVTVEVHLAGGLPAFKLVGLPDTEVRESRDRVRVALQNAQLEFPSRKIAVKWLYDALGVGIGAQRSFALSDVCVRRVTRP
jgi:hypothetical protein